MTGQVQQVTELVKQNEYPVADDSRTTTYQYDALDRLIRSISPDPADGSAPSGNDPNTADPGEDTPFMVYGYDVSGNLTSETDAIGNKTTYEYDRLYRQTKQTRVDLADDDAVTTFEYDLVGNLTRLIDPVGNGTSWSYDSLDRMTAETVDQPVKKSRFYEYDLVGNLTTYVDRKERRTTYEYDRLDRMTTEKWYDTVPTLKRTITYHYDLLSRLDEVTDRDGATTRPARITATCTTRAIASRRYSACWRVCRATVRRSRWTSFTIWRAAACGCTRASTPSPRTFRTTTRATSWAA